MTALCGGGTSSARPGFAATVSMTVPAIAALLNNVPTVWAVPFAALLGILNFELSTFCTTDPPAEPTMTGQDFVDMLTYTNYPAHVAAVLKFEQFVQYWAWPQLCVCDSGAAPSSGTPPTAPTGLPAVNPPGAGPSYPTGTPCQSYSFSGDQADLGTLIELRPIDGITNVVCTFSASRTTLSGSHTYTVSVLFFNATPTFTGAMGASIDHTGTTVSGPTAVPSGTTQFRIATSQTFGNDSPWNWQVQFDMYCNQPGIGGGGQLATPCVTDPLLSLQVQSILQLVTLIQRNGVPFAYIPGASHSALTGSGVLTIPSCIGVEISLTTIPGSVGQVAGDPTEYFEAGWYSWGTADGFTAREFIGHSPQLSFPRGAEQYTRIAYTLTPGVVATFTELYAET